MTIVETGASGWAKRMAEPDWTEELIRIRATPESVEEGAFGEVGPADAEQTGGGEFTVALGDLGLLGVDGCGGREETEAGELQHDAGGGRELCGDWECEGVCSGGGGQVRLGDGDGAEEGATACGWLGIVDVKGEGAVGDAVGGEREFDACGAPGDGRRGKRGSDVMHDAGGRGDGVGVSRVLGAGAEEPFDGFAVGAGDGCGVLAGGEDDAELFDALGDHRVNAVEGAGELGSRAAPCVGHRVGKTVAGAVGEGELDLAGGDAVDGGGKGEFVEDLGKQTRGGEGPGGAGFR